MTAAIELLPCPFCGALDVGFGRTSQKWQTVACNECGAEGPCTEIERDLIIKKWNTRASKTTVQRSGVQSVDERKTFESWFAADAMPLEHSNWFKRDSDSDYFHEFVGEAWKGWQARAALELPSAEPLPSKPEPTLWPAKGDMMTFLGKNGYPFELEAALKIFTPGEKYRVHDCEVGGWRHTIQFDGVSGRFNGVMFERCSATSTDGK